MGRSFPEPGNRLKVALMWPVVRAVLSMDLESAYASGPRKFSSLFCRKQPRPTAAIIKRTSRIMTKTKAEKVASAKSGKSLQDFRANHDKSFIVPEKIRTGLKDLGDSWEYELDFLRRCRLSTTDMGMYRDKFMENFMTVGGRNPKRCWSGSRATITRMKEMSNE